MMMVVKGHQFHLFIFVNIFVIIIVFFRSLFLFYGQFLGKKNMDKIYGRYKLRNLYYDKWKILTSFAGLFVQYTFIVRNQCYLMITLTVFMYISVTFNFRQEKIGKRRSCNWILTLRKYILEVPFKLEQHW